MRQSLIHLLTGSVGALLASATARALPGPGSQSSKYYVWFYRFTHYLLANFDKTMG